MREELPDAAFPMLIDGKAVDGPPFFPVENPADGKTFAEAPDCTPEHLDEAVRAARAALRGWSRDEPARRACLQAAAERLRANVDALAVLLTTEVGKPLAESRGEILKTVGRLEYFASLPVPLERRVDEATGWTLTVRRVPVGVVGVIVPWNYPINIGVNRMAPALLAGNTVVVKPSDVAPLTTLVLGRIIGGLFPPGVLNIVSGRSTLGPALAAHRGIDLVSFTGSTSTGRKVAESAGRQLKRTVLELGGNDAAVVVEPFDDERTAAGLVASAFANCGQVCFSVKRVYVPSHRREALVAAIVRKVRELRVGDGADSAHDLGPLATQAQLRRLGALVDDAVERGAEVEVGARRLAGEGYFYAPTVLTRCANEMPVVREEQFGPVLPIIDYETIDDAVAMANDSDYGLAGSVWSSDLDRAEAVSERLDTSTVWINSHGVMAPSQPHSGLRDSGRGTVGGGWQGLMDVTDLKVVAR